MAKYIDCDAFIAEKRMHYCAACKRRQGMKNGKMQFCYEIGDAPCRACDVADMLDYIEDFPATDVRPVVRCKDCKHWETEWSPNYAQFGEHFCPFIGINTAPDWFCADGERREVDDED